MEKNEEMEDATMCYLEEITLAAKGHNEIIEKRIKISLKKLPIWLDSCRNFIWIVISLAIVVSALFVTKTISLRPTLYFLLAVVVLWSIISFVLSSRIDNIKRDEFVRYMNENPEYSQMVEFLRQVGAIISGFEYGFYKYL